MYNIDIVIADKISLTIEALILNYMDLVTFMRSLSYGFESDIVTCEVTDQTGTEEEIFFDPKDIFSVMIETLRLVSFDSDTDWALRILAEGTLLASGKGKEDLLIFLLKEICKGNIGDIKDLSLLSEDLTIKYHSKI